MPSTSLLIKRLRNDFPQFQFQPAKEFLWSAQKQTIFFNLSDRYAVEFSLHELSHALLNHRGYELDIDLIKLERDAWEYACKELAHRYNVTIVESTVQNNLETYREWLHARSKCPDCDATGLQTKTQYYRCLACNHTWHVNEARLCALRRYSITQK